MKSVKKIIWKIFLTVLLVSRKFRERDPTEEILKAFRLFDDDKDGKINLKNLRRVAKELGENLSDDELQAMIDEFDKDQDGMSKRFFKNINTNFHV